MPLIILENISLAPLTTMRTGGCARFFVRIENIDNLREVILWAQERNIPIFVLGGGSNTLISDDGFSGLVIKIEIKGIIYNHINESIVRVISGAGEVWDNLVTDVVNNKLWGIENLSYIPGSVGGGVVQNIGAYGMEISHVVYSVDVFVPETMCIKTFSRDECLFEYRNSLFKNNKKFIIVNVSFDLTLNGISCLTYRDVKEYFLESGMGVCTLMDIRDAIILIRREKFPGPKSGIGTAGSFFKNPIITIGKFEELKKKFPDIKGILQNNNMVKLAAAWLLDHVGNWRGFRDGDVGVYKNQALVLVNYGTAQTSEILSLANKIKSDIKEKINVELEEEVVIVNSKF